MYDALLLVSFGGPEHPDDVLPFLANVTRGRGVPPERLAEVAEHYQHFGGVSPINQQCRDLLRAVEQGTDLPVYWGNRNWHPMLADTVARMRDEGVKRALAFVTSAYGGYSSCRQYLEDIAAARAAVGPSAPVIEKLRHFHDHPGFVEPHADAVRAARAMLPPGGNVRVVFTAHSIPTSMAATAGPDGGRYEAQLRESAALVSAAAARGPATSGPRSAATRTDAAGSPRPTASGASAASAAPDLPWDLVWQSRSGPPHVPWLEPDVNDHLAALAEQGVTGVVVSPIGFVSDHLEVIWDLDNEAASTAKRLGLDYARAATPGTDPRFVAMVHDLVRERQRVNAPESVRRSRLGRLPLWDTCPVGCCPPPRRGSVS